MSRLPTPGGDEGNWGSVLNDYLAVEHKEDGSHKIAYGLQTENVKTVTASGASQTIPAPTLFTITDITLTEACNITLPAATSGQSFTLILRQNAVGSKTVTWTGNVKWPLGTPPILTVSPLGVDALIFLSTDGSNWLGFVAGYDIK
jgi:hypothetical protein